MGFFFKLESMHFLLIMFLFILINNLALYLRKNIFIINHKEKCADFMKICAEQSPEHSSPTSIVCNAIDVNNTKSK